MRSRLGSLLVVASLAIVLTACSDGGGSITIGKSSDAPPTTTGTVDQETTVDSGDGTTDSTDDMGTIAGSSDDTVPDLGTLPGDLGNCVELGTALSTMGASATGQKIDEATKQQIEDVKAKLPDNIAADIDIVVSAYEKLGSAGGDFSAAAEAVSTPEFTKATNELSEYIASNCGG